MKAIYEFALKTANPEVLKNNLKKLLAFYPEEQQQRIIEILLNVAPTQLPEKVICNNLEQTLLDFNFLENTVRYEYYSDVTRWFKTPEEADAYAKTGDRSIPNHWSQSGPYIYEATHNCRHEGTTTIEHWLELVK